MTTAGICTAIAGLSISGVQVLDLSAVPDATFAPGVPCLFPDPQVLQGASGEVLTFKPRSYQVERQLRYIYLHQECGSMRLANVMPGLVAKADAVMTALLTLADSYRLTKCDMGDFGAIADPQGKQFWGFRMSLSIVEFV